jgi:outer membrane protein assembly factor BamB
MNRYLVASLLMLSCSVTNAAEVRPEWRRDFPEPIEWQRVTALGDLLVGTAGALYAVDASTGDVRWSHRDLAHLSSNALSELPGSTLALVTDGAADGRTVVVNLRNGTLVFDSRTARLAKVSSTQVLARSGSLLVAGFAADAPQPTLYFYSIEDGKQLWSSDALAGAANANTASIQSAPFELGDGTFVVAAFGNLYRFDQTTGNVLWKSGIAGARLEFRQAATKPDVLFVGAEARAAGTSAAASTTYQAFRMSDGQPLWKRAVQFRNPMNRLIVASDRGLVVTDGNTGKGRVHLLDYDTGQLVWGKGVEINGLVVDSVSTDAGLVLTTGYDSVWASKGTAYLVYVLDPSTGAMRFPAPLAVKGRLLSSELTAKGLLYVTTHELNVFDPVSGKLLNAPVLRGKQPIFTTSYERFVYAYNSDDGMLYRFNRESGQIVQLSQSPFMLGDGDRVRSLDLVGGRLVLVGQQTVAGFSRAGAVQFNAHYPAPRDPAWLDSLAWAEGVRAGMASAYAGEYGGAFASVAAEPNQGSASQALAAGLEQGFSRVQPGYADLTSAARKRYEASAESRDFVFMLVQNDDQRVSLAQVSKLDGKIVGQIDMRGDQAPSYQVDDVGSLIFHSPGQTTVAAYRFAPQQVRVATGP